MSEPRNLDEPTVLAFGEQWTRFDQSKVPDEALGAMFDEYFAIFPWERLPPNARGADVGCGSGRWARLVAARVFELHCVDASEEAVDVARRNLSPLGNVVVHRASVDSLPFEDDSLDFAYALGVLHHVPDTSSALRACVRKLKTGAPFLLYLYYAFDNRPGWYRALWRLSDELRRLIARRKPWARDLFCDAVALFVYWPLARAARVAELSGIDVSRFPIAMYRERPFYSLRTDARDRFGTPLEKRFRAEDIERMMEGAGLGEIRFSDSPPYWCALGIKR